MIAGVTINYVNGDTVDNFVNAAGATINGGPASIAISGAPLTSGDFTNNGVIFGNIAAIRASNFSNAFTVGGTFTNNGSIRGADTDPGILFDGVLVQFIGSVDGFFNATGAVIESLGFGRGAVSIGELVNDFENAGTISAIPGSGVEISRIVSGEFANSGTIRGGIGGTGTLIGNFQSSILTNFTNSGSISGISGIRLSENVHVTGIFNNSGTITGTTGTGLFANAQIDNPIINSGTITGNIGIAFNQAVTSTFPETVTNTGNITGTGGTVILFREGNDTLNHDAAQGTITGIVDGGADTDTFNLAAGAYDLTNNVNFETTNIQNGATGQGVGVIGGAVNVHAGGSLGPDTSIGTTTINGDLNVAGGANVFIEFDANALSADLIVVNGAAVIDGDIVESLFAGAAQNLIGNTFNIIEATGGITGITITALNGTMAASDIGGINITFSVVDAATVPSTIGAGQVLQATFSAGTGGGILNITVIPNQVNLDDVTDMSVTRTIGQQFNLPNGQGTIRLTLNANGSTTVQSTINGNTINVTSTNTLGGLNAGTVPAGVVAPVIVVDFNSLPPGNGTFDVATSIVRRDDGQTSVTTSEITVFNPSPDFVFIGDINDIFNIIVIQGSLDVTVTNTTTITSFFTDVAFTDQVIVENAVIPALIALLQDFPAIVNALAAINVATPTSVAIPTLEGWSILLLALSLIGMGLARLRRKKRVRFYIDT